VTTEHFFLVPARSAARVLRAVVHSNFAWGCFRDFLSRPRRAPPKGRYAGSGTRDRWCFALTGRIDPTPTHHALKTNSLSRFNKLHDGQITQEPVQPLLRKYSSWRLARLKSISPAIPSHPEGRFANVTDLGRGMRWAQRRARRAKSCSDKLFEIRIRKGYRARTRRIRPDRATRT
jgi:hypothetical protein